AALNNNIGVAFGSLPGAFSVGGSLNTLPSVAANPLVPGPGSTFIAPNTTLFTTPDFRTPYVQNYDFLLEHDLGRWGLVGSVGYSGNLGRQIPFTRELNSAAPGTGELGQPFNVAFGRTAATLQNATGLTSFYNSLQAQLTKRFSQGLSFTVAYT